MSFIFIFRRRLQDLLIKANVFALVIHTSSEDAFKTSSRRLHQDQYIRLGHMPCHDVFKTSSKHLQYVLQKRLQDIFRMSFKNVDKISSRHFQDIFKKPSRRIHHIFEMYCGDDLHRSNFWGIFGQVKSFPRVNSLDILKFVKMFF